MAGNTKTQSDESCPVSPEARAAWLAANKPAKADDSARTAAATTSQPLKFASSRLATAREVSSIPRARSEVSTVSISSTHAPSNAEQETGASSGGNWIYPSEEMFFAAMKRKNWDPQAADMSTIVPIHNAVNERAWTEIRRWEDGKGSEKCGGPKLASFSGNSLALTPKARLNSILGYHPPFDRHDWVIDRCGTKIEYVIDFYSGKPSPDGRPSFYLDVRPKLNTMEGIKMRISHAFSGWL